MPERTHRIWSGPGNPDRNVSDALGIDRHDLGGAIHKVKRYSGHGGADNVDIWNNGDLTDHQTGETLGNVYDEL